jgi:glycosyltransferase involved in cell wall biosynthesis
LLHNPQDPEDFAKCIQQVFITPASKWEPLRDAAYKVWQEKFTIEKMIDSLSEIYKKLGILE